MKIKKIIPAMSAFLTLGLAACNGGGNSSPASTTQYGQVVSISPQQMADFSFTVLPFGTFTLPANTPLAAGIVAAVGGDYTPESMSNIVSYLFSGNSESAYSQANNANTESAYNYSVYTNFIANNNSTGWPLNPTAPTGNKVTTFSNYAIEYTTPGQNAATDPAQIVRTASGLIIVPNMKAGNSIRGVVVYFHPTSIGKNQVPSCLGPAMPRFPNASTNIPDYCNVTQLDKTGVGIYAILAATYAAQGFVVVAPDYLGLGADYNNIHPFVAYPEVNVLSAFNMFPALRQILAQSHNIPQSQKIPLFITGYSEGGGYALKASQMAQTSQQGLLATNNLQLKITSPQEGAYSLADQMNFAFNNNNDGYFNCSSNSSYNCGNVDMMESWGSQTVTPAVLAMNNWNVGSAAFAASAKPYLTSYVLGAAMYYTFHNLSSAYNEAMYTQFWSGIPVNGTTANLYQLLSGNPGTIESGPAIIGAITANANTINGYNPVTTPNVTIFESNGTINPPLQASNYGLNNSGLNLIHASVAVNPQFQQILVNGSTYNWTTSSPINFIHMNYDSAVTVLNYYQAYTCMSTGTSYRGVSGSLVASSATCTAAPSGNLIGSTTIQNFQVTNNSNQMNPASGSANSHFWSYNTTTNQALPFEHGDMVVLGNIIALCTFEHALGDGQNSGVCPAGFN